MANWNIGDKNGMWKGGRTTASNGYVLIRVGKNHHLADCRGYAYEHRLVAEVMLGRPLKPNEIVHHKNQQKDDNRPENIEVMRSVADHAFVHRKKESLRRKPREPNFTIECACGCKENFSYYDPTGRPRIYVSGHNPAKKTTTVEIIECLKNGPKQRKQLIDEIKKSTHSVAVALSKMKKQGLVVQISHGVWAIKKE